MKYTITGQDIQELMFNYNIRLKNTEQSSEFILDKLGLGMIESKNQQLGGLNFLEWKANFDTTVQINSIESENIFALYFNLGQRFKGSVNGKELDIKAKSCNIWSFSSNDKAMLDYNANNNYHTFSVVFDKHYLESFINRYPNLFSDIYKGHLENLFNRWNKNDVPINGEINQILHQMQNANLMGEYRKVYIEVKIVELLVLQLNFNCGNRRGYCLRKFCKKSCDKDKMHEARNILLNDIANPPGIVELARLVGVNDHKLKNGFKEEFNQTPFGCLFEHRMNLAQQLLLDTDKTILEISFLCGYDYASHFTTAFKRRFGVSPSTFRKKH